MKNKIDGTASTDTEIGREAALVIIDVQKDFSAPDGKAPVCRDQADSMIAVINDLVGQFAAQNIDIIYIVNEWSNPIIRFLTRNLGAKGTPGAQLDGRLKVIGNLKFSKAWPSSFTCKKFAHHLREKGIKHLYITGLAAEYCVQATIKGALKRGYKVTAVGDGIAAAKCKRLERSLEAYQKKGAEVISSIKLLQSG